MYPYLLLSVSPYPNSALSAGQLALIAIIPVLALAAWLILVLAADRQPRRGDAAGTASLPRQPGTREQQEHEPDQLQRKVA